MRARGKRSEIAVGGNQPVNGRDRADRADTTAEAAKDRADRVQVSDDAKLLNAALQAAKDAPETSDAAVERARQKLVSGELGRDVERLADKLIDHLLR